MRIRHATTAGLVFAAIIGLAVPAAAAPTIEELPLLPNEGVGHTSGINDAGVIIGGSYSSRPPSRASRWSADGKVVELRPLPGADYTMANGINKYGTVVGRSAGEAVQWSSTGTLTVLPTFGGSGLNEARAINDRGEIAGQAAHPTKGSRSVRWAAYGRPEILEQLPGEGDTWVYDINNAGTIVGMSNAAVKWTRRTAERLPLLPNAIHAEPRSINDHGVIVGRMIFRENDKYRFEAVRWNVDGTVTVLNRLGDLPSPYATGINNSGEIVGHFSDVNGSNRAVKWAQDGSVSDLGTLPGRQSSVASAINDSGVIAGDSDGRPVRWTN